MGGARSSSLAKVLVFLVVVIGVLTFLVQRESGTRGARPPVRDLDAPLSGTVELLPPVLSAAEPIDPREVASRVEPGPPPPPQGEEPLAEEPQTFEERMAAKYVGYTQGQLLDARLALRASLDAMTKDYYEAEFEAGRFEFHVLEPNEKGWRAIPNVPGELSSLRYKPGGEARIVRLPREGFEEAYALSEEATWILHRESELQRQARTVRR